MHFLEMATPRTVLRVGAMVFPLVTLVPSLPGASAPAAPARDAAPKTHTLFMGADFEVMWQDEFRPVEEVRGNAFVVSVDGKTVLVPSRLTDLPININNALKLSASSATLSKIRAERAYTWANDPARRLDEALTMVEIADAAVDVAEQTLRENQMVAGFAAATHVDPISGRPDPQPTPNLMSGAEGAAVEASAFARGSIMNSIPDAASRAGDQAMEEQYDAFRVSFEISSAESLTNAYAVLVAHYRTVPDRPETSRVWVYALALPRVDTVRRKISFARGGFPPGYQLDDVQIHIYDQRGEIATSVSPRRVELTADEAFQYCVIDYVGQNRDKTVGPTPAKMFWPDLRARLSASQRSSVVYVKVSKDGMPIGVFQNEACTRKIADAEIELVLEDLRFNPALSKGKPVESIASLNLAQLGE